VYFLPFHIKVALPDLRFLANAFPKDSLVTGPCAGRALGLKVGSFLGGAVLRAGAVDGLLVFLVVSVFEGTNLRSVLSSLGDLRSSVGASGRAKSLKAAGRLVKFLGALVRTFTISLGIKGGFPFGFAAAFGFITVGDLDCALGFDTLFVSVLGLVTEVLLGALGLLTVAVLGRVIGLGDVY